MEIRNLATFVRIAQLHNFSKAAEQLGYSQSAVTMQIKQLEEELNVRLFERIGKHIRLTQAGDRLLPPVLWRCSTRCVGRRQFPWDREKLAVRCASGQPNLC